MLEGTFTQKITAELRKQLNREGFIIWKHNDMTTRGIPDFSVSYEIRTIWFEVKLGKNKLDDLQKYYVERLGTGALVIRAGRDGRMATIIDPVGSEDIANLSFDGLLEEIIRRCRKLRI